MAGSYRPYQISTRPHPAGNAGSQTTALLIRGLSLGTIKTKDFLKALRKEIAVGILVGGSLAIVCYGFLWVEKLIGIVDVNQNANYVFIAVSISLMLVVIVAKIIATSPDASGNKPEKDNFFEHKPLICRPFGCIVFVYTFQ